MNEVVKLRTLALVTVSLVVTGFAGRAGAAAITLTLEVGERERVALVYPARRAAEQPARVVFAFHGRGDTETNFARTVRLHHAWPEATVVYPRGLELAAERGMRGWGSRQNDPNADLAFVDALLEELALELRVDPDRIYVTGFSNGGRFVLTLLAARPHTFAAFAPVGAVLPSLEQATTPRPVIYLFGQFESKDYQDAWAGTLVALARLNGATGRKREWAPGYYEYPPRERGEPTVYSLYNAGHVWPHAGNEHIIRFFEEHIR